MYIPAARVLLATIGLSSTGAPTNKSQTSLLAQNPTTYNSTDSSKINEIQSRETADTPHNEAVDFSNYNSTYSFDSNLTHNPNWMTWLPSSTNITSLSIPGTHNSMTYDISWFYQCQNANLTSQLESGIRYLDIRARVINNELNIYHGNMPSIHNFTEVLSESFDFLDRNPGEVILMRVKEELGVATDRDNSNITFQQAFARTLQNDATKEGVQKHIWLPEVVVDLYSVPPLGELRGKIIILQDFGVDTAVAEFGIDWGSTLLEIEDAYNIPEVGGLDMKTKAVEKSLRRAMRGTQGRGDGKLYLTYLSGSGGIESINVAAADGGINDGVGKFIVGKEKVRGELGVVVMDVPGAKLIEAVLKKNPVGQKPSDWNGLQLHG